MNSGRNSLCVSLLLVILSGLIAGQQPNASSAVVVPRLMNYSGKAVDTTGALVPAAKNAGTIGATFAIYKEQYDGAPLWIETQSVTTDSKGNYTVQLGASRSEGLPLELFTSGQARWLACRLRDRLNSRESCSWQCLMPSRRGMRRPWAGNRPQPTRWRGPRPFWPQAAAGRQPLLGQRSSAASR